MFELQARDHAFPTVYAFDTVVPRSRCSPFRLPSPGLSLHWFHYANFDCSFASLRGLRKESYDVAWSWDFWSNYIRYVKEVVLKAVIERLRDEAIPFALRKPLDLSSHDLPPN